MIDRDLLANFGCGGGRGFTVQSIPLPRELLAELLEQLLIPEALFHGLEDSRFDLFASDRESVRADASVASTRAGEPASREHREPAAADAALRQPGEEINRTAGATEVRTQPEHLARLALPSLGDFPEVIWYDSEHRHLRHDQRRRWVASRHSTAGVRALHVVLTVPDHLANIQPVVQDAGPTSGAAERISDDEEALFIG